MDTMDTMRCIIISSDLTPVIAAVDNYDHDSVEAKPVVGDYEKALWFPREMVFSYDEKLVAEIKGDKKGVEEWPA